MSKPCYYSLENRDCLSLGTADAVVKFFWPGAAPIDACALCALRAKRIADAMGFQLPMRDISTGQEKGGPSRFQLLEVDDK